jgi:hypothetical protein
VSARPDASVTDARMPTKIHGLGAAIARLSP